MFKKMRWKGLLVLFLCLVSFCCAQRQPRGEFRDRSSDYKNEPNNIQSIRSSRDNSRDDYEDYGNPREEGSRDYGSSRERSGDDYDYEEGSYELPNRNSIPDRGHSRDSRRRNSNQVPDYHYDDGHNPRQQRQSGRTSGYSNNGGAALNGLVNEDASSHDDFADYNLGDSFTSVPEGRQGIHPRGPRGPPQGPRGPPPGPHQEGPRPRPHRFNSPLRQGPPHEPTFESFDKFGSQDRAFEESEPGFRNEFNSPRSFADERFDNRRPPPRENRGRDFRFNRRDQFAGPPFEGPNGPHGIRRLQPIIERGPRTTGGFDQPPPREFLGDDGEISPSMLAELQHMGLGALAGPAPSPSRPAPRRAPPPVVRAAPPPPAVVVAPIQQIRHAVAGIEARQASLQAVLGTDGKSAQLKSEIKAVNVEYKNATTDSNETESAERNSQAQPAKANAIIGVINAAEVLGAAKITTTNSSAAANTTTITSSTNLPFLLTTTGLPVQEKQINKTSTTGLRTTTTEPDMDEMTTIPVTLPPVQRSTGYKKRSSFLISKVPKRKVSSEYKFLKAFHSVYRGYSKRGGREACSMCSIEYCLTTCSRVLQVACAGVDYNFATKTCTIHSKENSCSSLVPEGRTTHYVQIPCEKDETTPKLMAVSKAEVQVTLVKTTTTPEDGDQDDVTEDEVNDVTENPLGKPKGGPPRGKIDSKEATVNNSKSSDFSFDNKE